MAKNKIYTKIASQTEELFSVCFGCDLSVTITVYSTLPSGCTQAAAHSSTTKVTETLQWKRVCGGQSKCSVRSHCLLWFYPPVQNHLSAPDNVLFCVWSWCAEFTAAGWGERDTGEGRFSTGPLSAEHPQLPDPCELWQAHPGLQNHTQRYTHFYSFQNYDHYNFFFQWGSHHIWLNWLN